MDTLFGYPVVITLETPEGPVSVADALEVQLDPRAPARVTVRLDPVLDALRSHGCASTRP